MTKLTLDASEALELIPYLRTLPVAERRNLAATCEVRHLAKGARAFSEGDPPAGVFLIVSGRVKLVRASPDGREQILHEEGPGATLAEVPVFDGGGYVASAVAVEESIVLLVPRTALLAAIDRAPGSAREVIRILAGRVRRFAALAEELSFHPVSERLAAYLMRGAQATGVVDLPPTREQLAGHVGTVREEVSRALSQLRKDGVIEIDGRRVRVLDAERLRRLAQGPTDVFR